MATFPVDKELYQRQIEATDQEIDALAYELCGSTEEETDEGNSQPGASEQERGRPRPAPFPSTSECGTHLLIFIASGTCVENGQR